MDRNMNVNWKQVFFRNFKTYFGSIFISIVVTVIMVKETRNIWGILIMLLSGVLLVAIISAIMACRETR